MKLFSKFSWLILVMTASWILFSAIFVKIPGSDGISSPKEGFIAPDFELENLNGEILQLQSLQGNLIVLNFWASWCFPCKTEMPAIQSVFEQYEDQGVKVLAVNLTSQDNINAVNQFVHISGLTFEVLYDRDGKTAREYQVRAIPTTFFIDRKGKINTIYIGGPMSEALIKGILEKMIGEG